MNGEVKGMPKLQLLRDFFFELEGPYTVMKLPAAEIKERVVRLEQLTCGVRFGYFSALVEYFIKSARVISCRRYANDVELVRYIVKTYRPQRDEWSIGLQLVAKYSAVGELLAYTFDPVEKQPMEVWAWIAEGDPDNPRKMHYPEFTAKWEDILDYAWSEKDCGGVFVGEEGGDGSMISCWCSGKENGDFEVEWRPYGMEKLGMAAETKSRAEMVDFIRRYMRGGLSEAQQCFAWTPIYDRIGTIEFADEALADVMRAKRSGQNEIVDTFRSLGIGRIRYGSLFFSDKKPAELVRLIKRKWRDGSLPISEYPELCEWLVVFYLAVRGDKGLCKVLAGHFKDKNDERLCNYWRKRAGLPELGRRRRIRREKVPENQPEFKFVKY